MQESTRRQYLALLGVELWLPRHAVDTPDAAPVAASAPPESAVPVTAPAVTATPGPGPEPAAVSPPAAAPLSTPAPVQSPASASASASASGETLGCSLLALPDGLLLLATYLTPLAPGLSGPEHALLASIAAALVPGVTLPAPDEFRWPPAGVRLPAVARPGAGADALVGLLAEQRRKRGLRDVLVLGESLAPVFDGVGARLGLRVVMAPSLAAMLSDPALKRACWDAAKPLRRGGA